MNMLGNQDTYNLNAKAAESHALLRFVRWLLEKHEGEFATLCPVNHSRQCSLLLNAATAALAIEEVLGVASRRLSRVQCQSLFDSYVRFLVLYRRAGGVLKPKMHLVVHMIQRSLKKGNPRLYSTYRDESINGVFAKIARSAHRRTWANVIHFKAYMFHRKNFEQYVQP